MNRCPSGLYFDDLAKYCTFKDEARCGPLAASKYQLYNRVPIYYTRIYTSITYIYALYCALLTYPFIEHTFFHIQTTDTATEKSNHKTHFRILCPI